MYLCVYIYKERYRVCCWRTPSQDWTSTAAPPRLWMPTAAVRTKVLRVLCEEFTRLARD